MTDSGGFIKVPKDEEEKNMSEAALDSQKRRQPAMKKRGVSGGDGKRGWRGFSKASGCQKLRRGKLYLKLSRYPGMLLILSPTYLGIP